MSYRSPSDLPLTLPLFPLPAVLLLPRGEMPLNIFEPRYLAMFDDALGGDRLIGMIQPEFDAEEDAAHPALVDVGCAGRITGFQETGDGRYLVTLTGVTRFRVVEELSVRTPYRQCRAHYDEFAADLVPGAGEEAVDRDALMQDAEGLSPGKPVGGRLVGYSRRLERGAGQRPVDDEPLRRPRKAGSAGSRGPQKSRRDPGRGDRDGSGQDTQQRHRHLPAIEAIMATTPNRAATPEIDPKLLEILVCPLTKATLEYDAERQELISRPAKLAYPIRDGIPIMLPEEARPLEG